MSLEAILAKIQEDAQKKADEIIDSAKQERSDALNQVKSRIKDKHHRDTDRIRQRTEARARRMKHHIQREMEKALLSHRRHIVDRAINDAVRKTASVPDYSKMIQALLQGCDLEGKVAVIISRNDESTITDEFLKAASSKQTTFVLSKERHNDHGGIIMQSGDISLNATLSMIAELHHDSMVMELSRLLPLEGQVE